LTFYGAKKYRDHRKKLDLEIYREGKPPALEITCEESFIDSGFEQNKQTECRSGWSNDASHYVIF